MTDTNNDKDVFMDTYQLAERWGLTPTSLHNWRARNQGVPWVNFGRAVRYRLSEIRAYEDEHMTKDIGPVTGPRYTL